MNYIKNSPSKVRLFAKPCKDMGANYTSLLRYCEVRRLSLAKVIQRVLELKEENALFLDKNHNEDANTGCPTKKFIFKIFVTQKLVKIKQ